MSAGRTGVTYQGYRCQAVRYRRSIGLNPELGSVEVNIETIKKIDVLVPQVHWRGAQGIEFPGPMTIKTFQQFIGRSTVATPRPIPAPAGGGFNLFGDLVMQTIEDTGNKPLSPEIRYKDVYIDESAIEEITPNLARIRAHDEGKLTIPLTDIRAYYRDHAVLLHSINVHLRSGQPDPDTIKKPPTKPLRGGSGSSGRRQVGQTTTAESLGQGPVLWSAREVFRFLFSQLPGTPFIDAKSDLFTDQELVLPDPRDIIGEGQPIVQVIQELLTHYGLEAKFLPEGNYLIDVKGRQYPGKQGQISETPRKFVTPRFQKYEKKGVQINRKTPAVMVLGRRRIKRQLMKYVPAYEHDDGRIYKLEDIDLLIPGYDFAKVKEQTNLSPDKQFMDVNPRVGPLHERRRELLRKTAFKLYAPATIFRKKGDSIADEDFEKLEFLPMQDCPILISELEKFNVEVPDFRQRKGDEGDWAILSPIVYAARWSQGFYRDFPDVEAKFNGMIETARNAIANDKSRRAQLEQLRLELVNKLRERFGGTLDSSIENRLKTLNSELKRKGAKVVKKDEDERIALLSLGRAPFTTAALERSLVNTNATAIQVEGLAILVREADNEIAAAEADLRLKEFQFRGIKKIWAEYLGLHLWFNLPTTVQERSQAQLDRRTGLVRFRTPAYRADTSFALDRESAEISGEAGVWVQFGWEYAYNMPGDWTTVFWTTEADPAKVQRVGRSLKESIVCNGLGKPTSRIKAKVIRDPNMRLWEMEDGTSFNTAECIAQSEPKAIAELQRPRVSQGFTFMFDGLIKAVLDRGVSSVQHVWAGDDSATHVLVNNPHGRAPLGPPAMTSNDIPTVDNRIHEHVQEER